jgi:hypothetical protein
MSIGCLADAVRSNRDMFGFQIAFDDNGDSMDLRASAR